MGNLSDERCGEREEDLNLGDSEWIGEYLEFVIDPLFVDGEYVVVDRFGDEASISLGACHPHFPLVFNAGMWMPP